MSKYKKASKSANSVLYYKIYLSLALIAFIVSYFVVDIVKAKQVMVQDSDQYDVLYEVKFHYEGYEEEKKLAYKFLKQRFKNNMPWIKLEHIGIDLFDLNEDGQQEVFAYVNGDKMCPRVGCPFVILRKVNSKPIMWEDDGDIVFTYDSPLLLTQKYQNYHDIAFCKLREFYNDSKIVKWKWNGNSYN